MSLIPIFVDDNVNKDAPALRMITFPDDIQGCVSDNQACDKLSGKKD